MMQELRYGYAQPCLCQTSLSNAAQRLRSMIVGLGIKPKERLVDAMAHSCKSQVPVRRLSLRTDTFQTLKQPQHGP